jgi:xanthine dehydrogenase accessory factor
MLQSGKRDDFRKILLSIPGEEPESLFLLEPVFTIPKLIIAGAGHIGKALSHLGRLLDFEVTVIDNREEYACSENLPDASKIIVKDIGLAISEIQKDKDSYIVIVTRGHNDDAEALKACINSDAGYVGMIGSRAKIAKMKAEFLANSITTEKSWERIYTPVGIDINSKTVEEIAVSIAAQLVKVRNGG